MNIQDIANLTGFSVATVSRAINNAHCVKQETRETIFKVIREHKYVPNAVARSLSLSDTGCIGVMVPDIENEFFLRIFNGIADIAEENNYRMMFWTTNELLVKEHLFLEMVQAQRLVGVIITPVSEEDMVTKDYLRHFIDIGRPAVLVDRDIPGGSIDGVFSDNVGGACDGVMQLINAGHRKIATISGPITSKPGKERLQGFLNAASSAGLDIPDEYILYGDFKQPMAYEHTKKLLEMADPPTAIFTANNMTTLGCLSYITEKKMKIGRDISIMGFDDIGALKAVGYKISVIDRDVEQMGREAMRLMLKRLNNRNNAVDQGEREKTILPCKLILRGSEKMRLKDA